MTPEQAQQMYMAARQMIADPLGIAEYPYTDKPSIDEHIVNIAAWLFLRAALWLFGERVADE